MNRKYKNGFTLIELLAVIVILAVIALIATPIIMNVINDSKKGAAKDSGYAIIKAAELMSAKAEFELPVKYTENDELNYKGTKPTKMGLEIDSNGKINLAAFIDGYCIVKGYSDNEIIIDDSKTTADTCTSSMNGNIVVDIKDGLIPVTIKDDGTVLKADTNTAWYDYDTKKWANAVSVTESSRSEYLKAGANTIVAEKDILAYYVYIPRYKYQLWNAEGGVSTEQEIKIEFERRSTPKSVGSKNLEWLTHPTFTFGSDELNGIWVGKFETTGTSDIPTILPGKKSLTNQTISTAFNMIQKMKSDTYGLSSYDTHMMKNMEWGAVAYLSHSKYGKNGEIWINNAYANGPSITGCSGTSVSASVVSNATACPAGQEYYNNGINASTTGNITGIYDMSGGVYEYMMGVMLDASGNPFYKDSGFTGATMPDKKYYDAYQTTTGNQDFSKGKLGDATREILRTPSGGTTGWYSDYSYIIETSYPWFNRGGNAGNTSVAGVFNFGRHTGGAWASNGSRAVAIY